MHISTQIVALVFYRDIFSTIAEAGAAMAAAPPPPPRASTPPPPPPPAVLFFQNGPFLGHTLSFWSNPFFHELTGLFMATVIERKVRMYQIKFHCSLIGILTRKL